MALTYELWDTESRNLVAERMSRDEAISFVRHTLATQGRSAVETLVLGTEDGNGDGEVIARGNALIDLVEREGPDLKPSATIASRVAD